MRPRSALLAGDPAAFMGFFRRVSPQMLKHKEKDLQGKRIEMLGPTTHRIIDHIRMADDMPEDEDTEDEQYMGSSIKTRESPDNFWQPSMAATTNQASGPMEMGANCSVPESGFISSQPSIAEFMLPHHMDAMQPDDISPGNQSNNEMYNENLQDSQQSGINVQEYPWMKEKKTSRKNNHQDQLNMTSEMDQFNMNSDANSLAEMKRNMEYELQQKAGVLGNLQRLITGNMKSNSTSIGTIIETVLDTELMSWKRNQQMAGNGGQCDSSYLDVLQNWCEGCAELIWTNLNNIKETMKVATIVAPVVQDSPLMNQNLIDLNSEFLKNLRKLVSDALIVEKQPPQVLKTNTRFSAKVRCLVGSKLNMPNCNSFQVTANLISEVQANHLLNVGALQRGTSGDILNNTGCMEFDRIKKQLSITFGNMQLKKIRRADKKGTESVIDEKFCLFFSFEFSIAGNLEFKVWTMSLPITVIVHGNQESHAWAAITWDNAFSELCRKPFAVPEKVPWGKLASTLDMKFTSVTGKSLSTNTLNYLAEKLFGCQTMDEEFDTVLVSWTMFSKTALPDRSFTFWDWFYSIMKLTKEHLKPLWVNILIHGFLRKQDAENMLSSSPMGTFLLRFSESELGGITIAWVGGSNEEKKVTMLQPFTAKDFAIRCLADRISDLSHLLYLYPNVPKNQAFSQYYSPLNGAQKTSTNGYLQPLLVTHVPGLEAPPLVNVGTPPSHSDPFSYPSTPHSFNPHSPTDPMDIKTVITEPSGSNLGTNDMDFYDFVTQNNNGMSFLGDLQTHVGFQ